jgi:16S rRNA (uracil1498-N3)-methyltransferase
MPSPWFFVSVLPDVGEAWPLSREEAKHALGARRLEAGDEVVLFDGRGGIAEGRIEGTRLRDGSVPVLVASRRSERWRGRAVHCATALPKGDRLATLVDMTAQLGVASLTPLRCERSVVGETANRAERIRRIQIEACKQARSAWLPELCEETTPGTLAAAHRGRLLVAQPRGARPREIAAELGDSCTVAIGPEGGFTDAEIEGLRDAGAIAIDLGPTILRIETAAVVAVAFLREPAG